ncbi:hypothetical protein BJ138DRAFT_1105592 [Hygrophoropsis aurantiaca]|uniref:Uncharacterized protein n=1 Tax=Hygrophoropsis aurantiaca TaxID=72124 RepID=A0ACB7ZZ21_9AGAM|nr:hypothetical protein BJ138DRAFT_1105592 [Hygrophoropsis aurantiaca]
MPKQNSQPKKTSDQQRRATLRWLEQPGVKEAQRKKARERTARNRARMKAVMDTLTSASVSDSLSRQHNDNDTQSPLPDNVTKVGSSSQSRSESPESSTCPSAPALLPDDFEFLTLPTLRMEVREWQVGWGPESAWEKNFSDDLRGVQEEGAHATDQFLKNCKYHVRKGRMILGWLRSLVQNSKGGSRCNITDRFLQVYDLSVEVLSELKFFEVKLDEYAPVVSSKKISEIRYHNTM